MASNIMFDLPQRKALLMHTLGILEFVKQLHTGAFAIKICHVARLGDSGSQRHHHVGGLRPLTFRTLDLGLMLANHGS
jgi:hypothetical protein